MPEFPPIAHVAVTVTDLERSTRWYSELLAAEPVLDEDEQTGGFHHTVFALGGGQLFGLHTHPHGAGDRFDEHRTGLDHVAFACRDRGELQSLDRTPGRAGHCAWRNHGRPLRLGCLLPRPRWNCARVLRAACLTQAANPAPSAQTTVRSCRSGSATVGCRSSDQDSVPCRQTLALPARGQSACSGRLLRLFRLATEFVHRNCGVETADFRPGRKGRSGTSRSRTPASSPGEPAIRGSSPATAGSPRSTPGLVSGTATGGCTSPRWTRRLRPCGRGRTSSRRRLTRPR